MGYSASKYGDARGHFVFLGAIKHLTDYYRPTYHPHVLAARGDLGITLPISGTGYALELISFVTLSMGFLICCVGLAVVYGSTPNERRFSLMN
ncbi:hypothetical protein [Agrobacterium radiobacter]|uniref:hypothetical protein n=1 Tax=Agrobacterium radiobacter TaxID=362 RepID=UPI003F824B4F